MPGPPQKTIEDIFNRFSEVISSRNGYVFGRCLRERFEGKISNIDIFDSSTSYQSFIDVLVMDGFELVSKAVVPENTGPSNAYKKYPTSLRKEGVEFIVNYHSSGEFRTPSELINTNVNSLAKGSGNVCSCPGVASSGGDAFSINAIRNCIAQRVFVRSNTSLAYGPEEKELISLGYTEISVSDYNSWASGNAAFPKKEVVMSGEKTTKEKSVSMSELFKADAATAAYRVASIQMTKGVKAAILKVIEKNGFDNSKLEGLRSFLDTEFGMALISLMLGSALPYIPMLKDDDRATKLSSEFRISGMAIAGNAVVDTVVSDFLPVIMGAMQSLPKAEPSTLLRVGEKKDSSLPVQTENDNAPEQLRAAVG